MTNRCEKCKRQFATDDDQDVFCSSCLDGQAGSRGSVFNENSEAYADMLDQVDPGGAFERLADPFDAGW